VPETFLELDLSTGTKMLYVVFLIHRNSQTGLAWPDWATLLRMSGLSHRSIKSKLDELAHAGLIERVKKRKDNRNEYRVYLHEPESDFSESDTPEPDSTNVHSGSTDQIPHFAEPDSTFCLSGIKKNQIKNQGDVLPFDSEVRSTDIRRNKARAGRAEEVEAYAIEQKQPKSDGTTFFDSMEAGGWMRGKNKIKDWKAHFRSYKAQGYLASQKTNGNGKSKTAGLEKLKQLGT
jgi:hypothetical protein